MSVKNSKLCCVIGYPIEHSLSPLIHNAGYVALGIEKEFTFQAFPIKPEDLDSGLETLAQLGAVGVSVTLPHKINVLPFVGSASWAVEQIGAANTLIRQGDSWHAENTDYLGILRPLEKLTNLSQKKVAILGASGAARAAVYAVKSAEASVKIFNRTVEKAEAVAQDFGIDFGTWDQLGELIDFDIIINCTSVGLKKDDPSPVSADSLHQGQIVFDSIYNQETTALLELAKKKGAETIHGVEMFIEQAREQFFMYTNLSISGDVFRKTLYRHFKWKEV